MDSFYKIIISFITTSCLFFGCSTIINGTKQDVNIVTEPAGAAVYDGDKTSQTPVILNLKRGKDHTLTIDKSGYEIEKITLQRKLSAASTGDVVMIGGVICVIIDAASGAMWTLYPDNLNVNLKPSVKPWYKKFFLNFKDLYLYSKDSNSEENDQEAMIDITLYFIRDRKKSYKF